MKQVLRFTANWCQPCKAYAPTFEKVVSEISGVSSQTIDVESGDPRIVEYGIRNIPTTIVIENNQIRKQYGVLRENQLRDFIQ